MYIELQICMSLDCNPVYIYVGISPIELNGAYVWDDMHRIALFSY